MTMVGHNNGRPFGGNRAIKTGFPQGNSANAPDRRTPLVVNPQSTQNPAESVDDVSKLIDESFRWAEEQLR